MQEVDQLDNILVSHIGAFFSDFMSDNCMVMAKKRHKNYTLK